MNTRKEYLSIHINDQMFGIPILQVQDVLGEQKITQIPLASSAIAGSLNLRGRIVTAIDVRKCLGLPRTETTSKDMSVVVEHNGELYSLIIDSIGDVLSLKIKDFEKNPATLDPLWRDISQGIFRLENNLLVVLDIPKLLSTIH
ncbi:MAG: chemotaxis protein CheW [Pseudomonadota bacterium]